MYSLKEAKNAAQDWIDELGTMEMQRTGTGPDEMCTDEATADNKGI